MSAHTIEVNDGKDEKDLDAVSTERFRARTTQEAGMNESGASTN